MKIAYITAGAGNMYCGSCLRDNTLASALIQAGHDVLLIPTYTPTRTDERSVSQKRIFLGGINIFLQQQFKLFRNTPAFLDRLLDRPGLLRWTTRWGVSVDPAQLGRLTVSMLQGIDGHLHKELQRLARYLADELKPEVVNLPNSLLIALAPAIKSAMDVPICCTLQGEELFLDGLGNAHRSESIRLIREHARHVDAFVAVSRFGARKMAEYLGIAPERIHVAPLGIHFHGYTEPRTDPDPFTIGFLARIAPEKGLHVLVEAFKCLKARPGLPPLRLSAAGYLPPEHKSYLQGILRSLDSAGLAGNFTYHGEVDREGKLAFLQGLSVLSVPGPYEDPKGLYLLEAMAAGVPVVQPRRGSFPEIVEATGGGILVDSDDPEALAEGIAQVCLQPEFRRDLSRRAYQGVRTHFTTGNMAQRMLQVYRSLVPADPAAPLAGRPEDDRA